ncbi:hypothetical protein M0534_13205 [Methylonatrum kenyense]|uniref:2OG-Fe(II) oxygenase n=1 Tax=Methylonatrum kenyense TaxID=455253 RepID=UPI0020C04DF4|nr:2OG-Fe(II) oxygenase [Methylonatrum kenyense]MCK8517272.1 hypothetical protein [Methylonatrum kenyense]
MVREIRIETPTPAEADFSHIVNRVLVFDDFYSATQLLLLQRWALESPHWMLNNAVYDTKGRMQHRIWGASYIHTWKQGGWPALPPTLFAAMATLFRRLGVVFPDVEYIGLNGQLRGQDASMHTDCARDAPDQLSILVYIGEDTDGDLHLFDKDEQKKQVEQIAFRPNRVVAFDGSIPHRALAPTDHNFRVSAIVRGGYRSWVPGPAPLWHPEPAAVSNEG